MEIGEAKQIVKGNAWTQAVYYGSTMVWPTYGIDVTFDIFPFKNRGIYTSKESTIGLIQANVKTIPGTTLKAFYPTNKMYAFACDVELPYRLNSQSWQLSTTIYIPTITTETKDTFNYSIVYFNANRENIGIEFYQHGSLFCFSVIYNQSAHYYLDGVIAINELAKLTLIHNGYDSVTKKNSYTFILNDTERRDFSLKTNPVYNPSSNKVLLYVPEYDTLESIPMYIRDVKFRFS